jgi:GNAT superfamily N-acetyltransferase
MTETGYTLEPVESLSPAAVATVRRIYEEGFPPHQRADFSAVTDERQDGELAFALVSGGQPRGFAMLRPLGSTGWVFLRYFVVDEGQRGRGIGGLLWDQLTGRVREEGFTLLVFDVDDPDEPGCGPGQARIRSRRIRFYQRHGAVLLPVTGYRTPRADAEAPGWTPMLLMTASLAGRPRARGVGRALDVVAAVYRYRWLVEPGDPRIAGVRAVGQPARGASPPT